MKKYLSFILFAMLCLATTNAYSSCETLALACSGGGPGVELYCVNAGGNTPYGCDCGIPPYIDCPEF